MIVRGNPPLYIANQQKRQLNMVRYTIEGSPIHIAYGYDKMTGVFLSVYDDRLKYDPNASDEINNFLENSSPVSGLMSGDGSYFDLHTGQFGLGMKASWPVMSEYLKRYGVPQDRIREMLKAHLKNGAK